jgi:hypothetical protein
MLCKWFSAPRGKMCCSEGLAAEGTDQLEHPVILVAGGNGFIVS